MSLRLKLQAPKSLPATEEIQLFTLTCPIVPPNPILRVLPQQQRYSARYPGTRSWHAAILRAANPADFMISLAKSTWMYKGQSEPLVARDQQQLCLFFVVV
ncbi:hypothetical protein E2562_017867 [Oryza meyeriana var. granulata]|uniref:Uncharacterized protein n=1 Tax=Oryza meyeriana var. granulata TaxID=110450 RepID=A0A6G1DYC9_9ORYZ|nr:hypothetical protein E2562_017867 [Oryza meyeriana var. granulata]